LRIALQAAGLLPLGLAVLGWSSCRDSSASSPGPQAAASVPAAAEQRDTALPGVDTSPMTPRERHEWSTLVGDLIAPCTNVPVPIAQCVQERRPCTACTRAAKWIAGAVRNGASEEQVRRAYKDRFDPTAAKAIPLDGSPTKGPDDAPVTVVELADFECPHCAGAVPTIDAMMSAHAGKVRLVYKSYTLAFHTRGEPAARAAFAAGMQGKFWEMEHLLFERQQHLEDADLERYARMLRLDIPKWKADMESAAVKDRIANDRKLGEELKVKGTPTIYVNGRELDIEQEESLEDRVASELGVAPAASASTAPTAAEGASAPAKPH
jgi:protein-disulfide isomerase